MSVNIRRATFDDIDPIKELFVGTIAQINTSDYSPEQIRAWISRAQDTARWKRRIAEQHFFVAENDTQILGFTSMTDDGYVDLLYVHHEHQGKDIGSQLLKTVMDLGGQRGANEFRASVSITARMFFEKHGFSVREQQIVEVDDVSMTNFLMTKNSKSIS